tara:strand:+ start:332 stop:1015 length:684 start_codon:yes stop_codon:yes gene_type:complete
MAGQQKIPKHIAIIMDGNGSWALERGLNRDKGHIEGLKALQTIVSCCLDLHIKNLTVFALSHENVKRPKGEIRNLLNLFVKSIQQNLDFAHKKKIKISFVGNLSVFPKSLLTKINFAQESTKNYKNMNLNIAINYGGIQDIEYAVKGIIDSGKKKYNIKDFLYTKDLPDVDLLIRTGGYQRMSNFLLWQTTYSEIYFTKIKWPSFKKSNFLKSLDWYNKIERKFGKL